MKKIDELILKILSLEPTRFNEKGSNMYYLFYKDITLCFWNMDSSRLADTLGLASVNSGDAYNISADTKKAVLNYFNKTKKTKISDLLIRVNKEIRKEKLLTIGNEN